MLRIGEVVDERYEILKEIDRGGMSIVYLAQDNRLKKSLAIKDIRKSNKIDNEILLKCLKGEADLLTALDHQTLPKIYDIIEGESHIYVVMDYIEGESLKKKLDREKVCSYVEVIEWGKQLSEVLDYLHKRKPYPIIYRDMKPHNIMITPEGKLKLIDFGTAIKINSEARNLNFLTDAYAAPEQMIGEVADERTDIYNLGVTLYHLVTGFKRKDNEYLRPVREINPALPEGLDYVISKCIRDNPSERYQSAAELNRDLFRINKMNKAYKKKIIKDMSLFLVSCTFFLVGVTVTVYGKGMINKIDLESYTTALNEVNIDIVDKDYTQAIKGLDKIIVDIDSSKPEAYIKMMDVYNLNGDTKGGVEKVEAYVNQSYGGIHKNDDVLFSLAMNHLNIKNYPIALKYFKKVSRMKYPEVKYYKMISEVMSSMNIDYKAFAENLLEFEKYIDDLANDENKILNYISIANIYSSYKTKIEGSNDKIIKIVEKSDGVLALMDNEELRLKYEVELSQKLAQAYHSKGNLEKDNSLKDESYNKAILIYKDLIKLEVNDVNEVILKVGDIYSEKKEYQNAMKEYEVVIKKDNSNIKAHCKLVNALLDIEQNKIQGQDYIKAKDRYKKITEIKDHLNNAEFLALTRRMTSLGLV
ncbi:MAG: protein kinase domain-containing protein [Sarcina sp.]